MKRLLLLPVFALLFACTPARQNINVVPYPNEVTFRNGEYELSDLEDIVYVPNESLAEEAYVIDVTRNGVSVEGVDNVVLVTDSMRGAGMPEGPSILGGLADGQECIVENGVAKLLDRSGFAGSVCTADRLVRTMITIGGCTLEQAVQMVSLNPARVMGVADRKGSLEVGKDADIVIFGDNVEVFATIVSGRKVYQK